MDDIVMRCSVRRLQVAGNRKFIEKKVVGPTYGFDYQEHFRKMLIHMLGMRDVERLERRVDGAKKVQMEAVLSALKVVRNQEAHTHVKGVTKLINAPSVTISHFTSVYEGLVEYDRVIRSRSLL